MSGSLEGSGDVCVLVVLRGLLGMSPSACGGARGQLGRMGACRNAWFLGVKFLSKSVGPCLTDLHVPLTALGSQSPDCVPPSTQSNPECSGLQPVPQCSIDKILGWPMELPCTVTLPVHPSLRAGHPQNYRVNHQFNVTVFIFVFNVIILRTV